MRANQKADTRVAEQLSEADLEKICGGIKVVVDKSSPNLFFGCCTGKHIANGTAT
jgi:type VI protein secretion system component Hcp